MNNSKWAGWGGAGAVTGPEARRETLVPGRTEWNFTHYTCSGEDTEADTLHQHLQGPETAARGALEFYTFTLASLTLLLTFQPHRFGTDETKKKKGEKKSLTHLVQRLFGTAPLLPAPA